jgi:hypothetical protein
MTGVPTARATSSCRRNEFPWAKTLKLSPPCMMVVIMVETNCKYDGSRDDWRGSKHNVKQNTRHIKAKKAFDQEVKRNADGIKLQRNLTATRMWSKSTMKLGSSCQQET